MQEQAPSGRPVRSRRKTFLSVILVLLGLAALGGFAYYLTHRQPAGEGGGAGGPGGPGGARRGPPATTVGVARAEMVDLPVTLEALGTVTAAASVTVRPQVSGVLKEVAFTEGQLVKQGQLLAVIDPRPFEIALMQTTGQRQRDEAQLDNARLSLQRFQTLLAQDSIARQEVDTQAALVKQLQGTVMADRAAENNAKLNLSYTRVLAPIAGRIGLRQVDPGNVVSTNDANGLVAITQVTPIDVTFAVPQDRVPEVRASLNEGSALPVTVFDRGRETELASGRFLALDNLVDVQTGTVKAKARFTNETLALFPSQFVNVRMRVRQLKDAIVVPVNAVRHGSNGDYVYVVDAAARTVALRPVKRGLATPDKLQITSGLQAGEQVVTEGADRLQDGARVNLPGERAGQAGQQGGQRQGGRRRNAEGAAGAAPGPAQGSGQGRPRSNDAPK
ncbi:efflux RND transporter periplasmic adaptor subunit [Noviherbaspirillum humi]|nr:efflux RND transporter periplasmic adaptor subunit [Noviherbaspirillum humi]